MKKAQIIESLEEIIDILKDINKLGQNPPVGAIYDNQHKWTRFYPGINLRLENFYNKIDDLYKNGIIDNKLYRYFDKTRLTGITHGNFTYSEKLIYIHDIEHSEKNKEIFSPEFQNRIDLAISEIEKVLYKKTGNPNNEIKISFYRNNDRGFLKMVVNDSLNMTGSSAKKLFDFYNIKNKTYVNPVRVLGNLFQDKSELKAKGLSGIKNMLEIKNKGKDQDGKLIGSIQFKKDVLIVEH
jgi:hypothetical protein